MHANVVLRSTEYTHGLGISLYPLFGSADGNQEDPPPETTRHYKVDNQHEHSNLEDGVAVHFHNTSRASGSDCTVEILQCDQDTTTSRETTQQNMKSAAAKWLLPQSHAIISSLPGDRNSNTSN